VENRIQEVLREKNVKQIELAIELGVVKSTVSMWCSNASQPPLSKLGLIADFLGCDLLELIVVSKKKQIAKKRIKA
jgi:transcriptional regulator with XRE-family HTH domain